MCIISREELIEETKETVELDILKTKLEDIFCHESSASIKLQEDCNEVFVLLDSIEKSKDLKTITLKLYESAKSVGNLANKHYDLISEEVYEQLISLSEGLELWGDVCSATSKIDKGLKEDSSLETLKKWSKWIELFVQIISRDENLYSGQNWTNVEKLAKRIIEVTFIKNRKETTKNHYKIFLKTSAEFILSKIENNKSAKSWKLVMGNNSYQDLLRASQKAIKLLNELDPKSNEEMKNQLDTLEYLEKHLK